jgi:hypothetical protein
VNESNKPHMDELREHLMATLASLRDRESPMDVDRARAVAQVAGVLVDTAKVEVEFIKATNGDSSSFIGRGQLPAPGESGYTQGTVTHEPGRTVHKLRG